MDSNIPKGKLKEFTGSVEEGVGKLVGSDKMKIEGAGKKVAGKVQNAIGHANDSTV